MFLTRPPREPPESDPVRLACIRHAASVDPEPGSNSPPAIAVPDDPTPLSPGARSMCALLATTPARRIQQIPAASRPGTHSPPTSHARPAISTDSTTQDTTSTHPRFPQTKAPSRFSVFAPSSAHPASLPANHQCAHLLTCPPCLHGTTSPRPSSGRDHPDLPFPKGLSRPL